MSDMLVEENTSIREQFHMKIIKNIIRQAMDYFLKEYLGQ